VLLFSTNQILNVPSVLRSTAVQVRPEPRVENVMVFFLTENRYTPSIYRLLVSNVHMYMNVHIL